MMRYVREFRLIPVVLLATICLFGLKVLGLVLDGGYTFKSATPGRTERLVIESAAMAPAPGSLVVDSSVKARLSWAQDMFGFPEGEGAPRIDRPPEQNADNTLITGSVAAEKKPDPKPEKPSDKAVAPPATPDGKQVPVDGNRQSPGERAILERLGERRQELDSRARELEIRENLLKSAEKRLETRGNDLKEQETRIGGSAQKKDETMAAQFKGLVTMYENMKAKDAARIFDRLEMRVLIEVATLINPRRMADIMAQMTPESAERLTVEMANRASGPEKSASGNDLPKIEGRPAVVPAAEIRPK